MNVNGLDDTRQYQQKLDIFIGRISRVKQIYAVIRGQRPVVMFPGAVHAFEGLFMEQTGQTVPPRYLLHGFHHKLVMVNCNIGRLVNCRQLVLRRSHFVVLGLGGNAQLPELYIQILHISAHTLSDGSEIMVFHLLPLRRLRAEQRPPRINKVRPFQILFPVYQKILLLRPHAGLHLFRLGALIVKKPCNTNCLMADGLHGTEQRRFFVQSLPIVGAKRGGNAENHPGRVLL